MALLQLFETGNGIKLVNPEELISDNTVLDLTSARAFSYTAAAPTIFSFQNSPSSGSVTFNLRLTDGGSQAITWPANVTWLNGSTPALQTSGDNILRFTSTDGGVTWLGADASSPLTRADLFTGASQVSAWIAVDSKTTSSVQYQIRSLNGRVISVGAEGSVTSTQDGLNWTKATTGTTNEINAVAFGAGVYVVVGAAGVIRTSPDLVTWTARTSGTTNPINDVTFGNGLFVAGTTNAILTSPDGITWTSRATAAHTSFGLAYGNGIYVSVGANTASAGLAAYRTSTDGITWTARTNAVGLKAPITFNAKTLQFMCVSSGTTQQIAYSATGLPNFTTGNGYPGTTMSWFATSGVTTVAGRQLSMSTTIDYKASVSGNTWIQRGNVFGPDEAESICWSDDLSAYFACAKLGRIVTTL